LKKHTAKNRFNEGFFERVFDVARLIPEGRVTSYSAIARFLGSGQSARMVGWAMNSSHTSGEHVPAHRVVNHKGLLTGKHHFGTTSTMQQLLENEGVRIENDMVVDFDRLFWDPVKELT